ncbi:baseplate J/gp47 family protein [Peptoniphilus sp. EMRHCC_23]|uniref:baseplate assembly protein n=1 Tax=Peptoniphilus rachelemmaiella TaxID=2811779 RepID=UPI001C005156|nr:baseplate J/gp47 family protein [Peptoniphilus rachelemmaiella]
MNEYFNLQPVEFVDIDVEKIKSDAVDELEKRLGKDIYPASPERIMLLTLLDYIIQDRELINDTGKQNLLAYSRDGFLDHMGALMEEVRFPAYPAQTTLEFTISQPLDYVHVIPSGTRVRSMDGAVFSTTEPLMIAIGEVTGRVTAASTEPGAKYNAIPAGQIINVIDTFPHYQSVKNVTATGGGTDREDDDHYRIRIHEAPEKFSTAGPDGAYRYWARTVNPNVGDVAVWSPKPGVAQVVPLYVDGSIPGEEVLDDIKERLNDRSIRPLTDKVEVVAPTVHKVDLEVDYWISETNIPFVAEIKKAVDASVGDFVTWQKSRLGRDFNPSQLITLMVAAGAKRVDVKQQFTVLKETEVCYVNPKVISYKGVEAE